MNRHLMLFGLWAALATGASFGIGTAQDARQAGSRPPASRPVMQVYKSRTCGCCKQWVEYARAAGFDVRTTDLDDEALAVQKTKHGVLPRLRSCHTAVVDGYVVEGHVPAEDIRRLLATRPKVTGLAVPDMPRGSPGMDMPDGSRDPYEVIAFTASGSTRTFAKH